jgi:Peptidase A4 family
MLVCRAARPVPTNRRPLAGRRRVAEVRTGHRETRRKEPVTRPVIALNSKINAGLRARTLMADALVNGFNPLRASAVELQALGFPPRPPLNTRKGRQWSRMFGSGRRFVAGQPRESLRKRRPRMAGSAPTANNRIWSGVTKSSILPSTSSFQPGFPPPFPQINWVSGVWTVPNVVQPLWWVAENQPAIDVFSAYDEFTNVTWIGIDGTVLAAEVGQVNNFDGYDGTSASLLQAGVLVSYQPPTNDFAVEPFVEWVPAGKVPLSHDIAWVWNGDWKEGLASSVGIDVSVGDTIHIYLEAFNPEGVSLGQPLTQCWRYFANLTQNTFTVYPLDGGGAQACVGVSADWMVEQLTVGNTVTPLARYGTVVFVDAECGNTDATISGPILPPSDDLTAGLAPLSFVMFDALTDSRIVSVGFNLGSNLVECRYADWVDAELLTLAVELSP